MFHQLQSGALGCPIVAYHSLNGGSVLGGFHQLSITAAAMHRIEFGYTRDFHQSGSTAGLSNLSMPFMPR